MITLEGITKTYRSKAGAVEALRGVTYHFRQGSFTAVMGPSGSGKSTLLQCAAGLDQPTTGSVLLGHLCHRQQAERFRAYVGHRDPFACRGLETGSRVLPPRLTVNGDIRSPL